MSDLFFSIDVEAIGLHGRARAFGVSVVDADNNTLDEKLVIFPLSDSSSKDEDVVWYCKNVSPALLEDVGVTPIFVESWIALAEHFWSFWLEWKAKGAMPIVDCGWPVETNFLSYAVSLDLSARKWSGPYPLHEIGTLLLACGLNPAGQFDRLPRELPLHHPLADARQSARIWTSCLKELRSQVKRGDL